MSNLGDCRKIFCIVDDQDFECPTEDRRPNTYLLRVSLKEYKVPRIMNKNVKQDQGELAVTADSVSNDSTLIP